MTSERGIRTGYPLPVCRLSHLWDPRFIKQGNQMIQQKNLKDLGKHRSQSDTSLTLDQQGVTSLTFINWDDNTLLEAWWYLL